MPKYTKFNKQKKPEIERAQRTLNWVGSGRRERGNQEGAEEILWRKEMEVAQIG